MKNISSVTFVFLVFLLSLFTFLPLLHEGFFNFHDNTQVVRVSEMANSLSSGMFPVRWVAGLGYGYGYPIFNFYGPLPYYLGGVISLTGFDVLFSTKLMFIVGIATSGISMFFLSKKFFGEIAGVVSGVLYAYFPYHAVNIYVRGAVGEFFAYAFLPIILLGVFEIIGNEPGKIFSRKNIPSILKISIGFFLVATSHNLTLFMLLLLLIPLSLSSILILKFKKIFIGLLLLSIFLGVLLSSFYILPAFSEMKSTNVASQVGGGAEYSDHFVCIPQYWNSAWGYGGSTVGCSDGLSFKLGKLNILLLILSLAAFGYAVFKKTFKLEEKIALVSFVTLLASIFFTIQLSQGVWGTVPYMPYLQYPWRFINFVGLFLSFLSGYLIFRIEKSFSRTIMIVCGLFAIVVTLILNYKLFEPQRFVNFPPEYYTDKNYVRYVVSKISDEYMPPSFTTPKSLSEVPVDSLSLINTTGSVKILELRAGYIKASVNTDKDGVIHVNRAYFPTWNAYENGRDAVIVPTHNGMNVSLSAGSNIFELKFRQTTIEMIANYLSIVGFGIILIVIISPYLSFKGVLNRKNV